ncbi:MAG: AraC family transcriptional regulator [Paenibacillus sp.]|jgi:AraC-like DNA-binding protein|nr:AraC family transcriptional regulator [Paenibacillus sp.]
MTYLSLNPLLPFIRESNYAVRDTWFIPERRLLDYLLIYIKEGHCVFHVEGVDYDLEAGEFCLIQPNQTHTLRGIGYTVTPFIHFDIFFNQHREQSFPTRPGQIDLSGYKHLLQPSINDFADCSIPVKFKPSSPSRVKELMLKMVGLWQQSDLLSQLEAQHIAMELVLVLLRDFTPLGSSTSRMSRSRSLSWITSYFSLHLAEPLTLADMASRAQLSPSRFSALFRQQYGVSPYQFLLHLRVEHAQDLLTNTELTLRTIAEYCGFADEQHFSKQFKKMTGQSPGGYRQGRSGD